MKLKVNYPPIFLLIGINLEELRNKKQTHLHHIALEDKLSIVCLHYTRKDLPLSYFFFDYAPMPSMLTGFFDKFCQFF